MAAQRFSHRIQSNIGQSNQPTSEQKIVVHHYHQLHHQLHASPTALHTYSPTISDCNILIVSDSSDSNNKMNTTYFENWKYYLLSTKDFYNR
eukprot:505943_1